MRTLLKRFLSLIFKAFLAFQRNSPVIIPCSVKNILIVKTGGIGDIVMVFPAMETLCHNFPGAALSVLAFPRAREAFTLFKKNDSIREIIDYDPEGIHSGFMKRLQLALLLRRNKYDIVYLPERGRGTDGTLIMSFLSGAPCRIGYDIDGVGFLNTTSLELRRDVPITRQNLLLLKAAGLAVKTEDVRLNITESDLAYARRLTGRNHHHPLVSIHTGAVWNATYKCWPADNYISLIKSLISEFGAKVVIIGSREEMGGVVAGGIDNSAVMDTSGMVTLSQMAAIIKLSDIFIGNDSGPLHIADALGIPYIGIFGPTSPEQILSSPAGPTRIRLQGSLSCSPCYLHHAAFTQRGNGGLPPCRDVRCPNLDTIKVMDVLNAVKKLVPVLNVKWNTL